MKTVRGTTGVHFSAVAEARLEEEEAVGPSTAEILPRKSKRNLNSIRHVRSKSDTVQDQDGLAGDEDDFSEGAAGRLVDSVSAAAPSMTVLRIEGLFSLSLSI